MSYKITYFCTKTKKVTDKIFTGKNAFEDAVNWGRKALTNFNTDLIQTIFY